MSLSSVTKFHCVPQNGPLWGTLTTALSTFCQFEAVWRHLKPKPLLTKQIGWPMKQGFTDHPAYPSSCHSGHFFFSGLGTETAGMKPSLCQLTLLSNSQKALKNFQASSILWLLQYSKIKDWLWLLLRTGFAPSMNDANCTLTNPIWFEMGPKGTGTRPSPQKKKKNPTTGLLLCMGFRFFSTLAPPLNHPLPPYHPHFYPIF